MSLIVGEELDENIDKILEKAKPGATFKPSSQKNSCQSLFSSRVTIWMPNDTGKRILVTWADFSGNFVPLTELHPQQMLEIRTYSCHQWVFFEVTGGDIQLLASVSFSTTGYLALSKVISVFDSVLEGSAANSDEELAYKLYGDKLNLRAEFCDARMKDKIVPFNIHDSTRIYIQKKKTIKEPYAVSLLRSKQEFAQNAEMAKMFTQESSSKGPYGETTLTVSGDIVTSQAGDPGSTGMYGSPDDVDRPDAVTTNYKVVASFKNKGSQSLHFGTTWIVDLLKLINNETLAWVGFKNEMLFLGLSFHLLFLGMMWAVAVLQAKAVKDREVQDLNMNVNNYLRKAVIINIIAVLVAGPLAVWNLRPVKPGGGRLTKRTIWKRCLFTGEVTLTWQKVVFWVTFVAWIIAIVGLASHLNCAVQTGWQSPDACSSGASADPKPPTCNILEKAMCCDNEYKASKFEAKKTECSATVKEWPLICDKEIRLTCIGGWLLPAVSAVLQSLVALFLLIWWRPAGFLDLGSSAGTQTNDPKKTFTQTRRIANHIVQGFFSVWDVTVHGIGPVFPVSVVVSESQAESLVEKYMLLREGVILSEAQEHCRFCSHQSRWSWMGHRCQTAASLAADSSGQKFAERGRGEWRYRGLWCLKWWRWVRDRG
eukprot:757464-Hanusia_phi.AAC.1